MAFVVSLMREPPEPFNAVSAASRIFASASRHFPARSSPIALEVRDGTVVVGECG